MVGVLTCEFDDLNANSLCIFQQLAKACRLGIPDYMPSEITFKASETMEQTKLNYLE